MYVALNTVYRNEKWEVSSWVVATEDFCVYDSDNLI